MRWVALVGALSTSLAQPPQGTAAPGGSAAVGPNDSGDLLAPTSLNGNFAPDIVATGDSTVPTSIQLAPGQQDNANEGVYLDFSNIQQPQPLRASGGGTKPTGSPDTSALDRENSDVFAPPGTDAGSVPNAVWPLGLSHNRAGLNGAGWARQQNTDVLPAAKDMAGVDMRLSPYSYRELHWHSTGEWAYILVGSVRVSVVNSNGQSYIDDLQAGDVWFFPSGIPHSIQALDEGVEFLLIFDDGSFSEDDTALASELFMRNPKSVLAKNFKTDIDAFNDIPMEQLYIFTGTNPGNISSQNLTGPSGYNLDPQSQYTFHWSQQDALEVPDAGSVKILDTRSFPSASDFAVALITVKPGAMRELHWHIDSDEWNFFIKGQARITIFSAPSSSRTYDYHEGDVGYIPIADAHYIENTGDEDLVVLEVLQAPQFTDISVAQWLGLTPKQVVKETLNLPDEVIDNLPKYKPILIPGHTNLTNTNYTGKF